MGRPEAWKVLEETIADFRKKGVVVPTEIMTELTSAKTLIHILKADPSCADVEQRIEECLMNVESYVISKGQMMFGIEYVDKWSKKLDEASKRTPEKTEEKIRPVPHLPRDEEWMRIKPSAQLPIDKLKSLADELHLSCEVQEDFLLVHGKDERLKEFVKEIATRLETKLA